MSAETLRNQLTIPVLAKWGIISLMGVGGEFEFNLVNVLPETFMIVVIVAVIVLGILPVLYAIAVRAGVMIDILVRMVRGIASASGIDMLAGVGTNFQAVIMTSLELMTMLSSLEAVLRFVWETFSCWTTTVCNDRAVQP